METKKILIWGEAGVGKTTFCPKFCLDWALVVTEMEIRGQELAENQKSELEKLTEEQRSKLNNIGLLFYIVLRDIGSKTVEDIIISKLGFNKLNDSQLLSILERVNERNKFVIVMDGFDEISDKVVEDVLTNPTYHKIHSVITCGPHASCGILNVDAEIRLNGFSEAQAKDFVKMYANIKYKNQLKEMELFISQTMSQIESSTDLLEMSTNPLMLQLLCLLSWKMGTIGKDRISVFKDYTSCLLAQYHFKLGKIEESYSDDLYHQNLLDAGKVALMGLRQNQLDLVFSESEARQIGGNEIFDVGFFTELPRTDTDIVRVQFTHKTLQEYLAAFYVVNTPGDEGLQLLMEFCSTSQRLKGSQIILEFISKMSTDILGTEKQNAIKDFVSKWDSDDKVDPRNLTSFLISMLEGTETLKFPLPAVIDIDFIYSSYEKSALERFLGMDGQGVRKINLTLDQNTRLNVLQNTTIDYLDELNIVNCWSKIWIREDNEDLCDVMKKMKPGVLSLTCCHWKLMDNATIAGILEHVYTLILEESGLEQEHLLSILRAQHHFKFLKVNDSGVKINGELMEAVSKLPSDIKLDISGKGITLIHKSATMKSLMICNCGIKIDTEIAEAVSRLPDDIQLDLSGNKLTKMYPRLLAGILVHMPEEKEIDMTEWEITIDVDIVRALSKMPKLKTLKTSCNNLTPEAAKEIFMSKLQKLDLSNCAIQIDTEIAEAVSRFPDDIQLDLSGNQVTDKSACITLIHKAAIMKSLNIHNCMSNCGIQIDREIAEAVTRLTDHTDLDLSGNQVTDKSACIVLIHKAATMKSLNVHDCISNCGIQIDTEIAEAVSILPDDTQLDLSGNQVTDKSACITLIHRAATMKSLNIHDCMSNCGIQIDSEIAEAVSKLPDHTQLDLSGNQVTDKSACITLIHKAATMKSLSICNCGIQIDSEIAEAVSRLPDHTQLDLSGNQVTDKSACITLIHKAGNMKSLHLCNCGIQINREIAEAVSRLPDHAQLDLYGNQVTDKSACITLIHKVAIMNSLNIHDCISNCGINIDTEIAEAVSRLPDDIQLDLSGNQVTDKSACITLIHKASTMKSLNIHNCMYNCGIQIDTEIAQAVSRVPDHTLLDLSGNQVTDKSACITLIHKAATMKSLNIHKCMSNCGLQIDTEIAEAVSRLPDHTQLDLSGNELTTIEPRLLPGVLAHMPKDEGINMTQWGITIDVEVVQALSKMPQLQSLKASYNKLTPEAVKELFMSKLQKLDLSNCGLEIDTEMAEVISSLPDHLELDLSGNQVTDKSACILLIHKAATMGSLNIHDCMSNCGIQIDTEIAEAVSKLPDHTQLDLSGNQVTDKSACVALIHTSANMKSLYLCNCGIQINRLIAEAVSMLPDDIQLDLSGNKLTKIDPRLLPGILLHMPADKKIDMTGLRITIDVDIVKALSKMPQLKSLNASFNKLTPEAAKEFSMSQLQQLYLCGCGINDNVCVPLMKSLSKHCIMLEVLDLYDNCLTSDDWCHHVQMKKLTKLDLNDCGIRNTVCVPLTNSLSKHCPLLEVLNLGFNRLSSSGVWDIVDQIKNMKKLRQLSFSLNPCVEDWQCREKLKEALQKLNPGLKFNTGY